MQIPSTQFEMNILLVDDRPENILVLEELLEKNGRTFIKAKSGNEALRLVLKHEIGLILLDVQMPDMDGFEVAAILKSNPLTKNIPIIFITAISKEEKYVIKGLEGGAIDYLYKPLNASITKAKINVFEELYHSQQQIKKGNQELKLLNTELQDLNQQKNYFLGMAAHDLRNPVAIITQLSELILIDLQQILNADQLKLIQNIQKSSEYMLRLLEDLLDVSKIESGKLALNIQSTPISHFLNSILELNKMIAAKKNIQLHLNTAIQSQFLFIDKIKMEQVINNLVSNAIKFSKPNTNIYIKAIEQNHQLTISVKDEGPGIPKEEQSKLFKAFQTTSVQSTAGEKSTGLGLMISDKIIKAHGGSMHVESTPGKGSEFSFTLPITIVENKKANKPSSLKITETELENSKVLENNISGTKTILVAEDDKLAQMVIKKMLTKMGFNSILSHNGKEALELIQTHTVDAVLMDMNMPLVKGPEAARQIRALTDTTKQNIPIIGLTASGINSEIEECLVAGMNRCLTKPIIMSELLHILQEMLKEK